MGGPRWQVRVHDMFIGGLLTVGQTILTILVAGWVLVGTGAGSVAADVEAMKAATVKITVVHDGGTVFGSGIILCQENDRLMVLTARHIVSGLGTTHVGGAPSQRFLGVSQITVAFRRNAVPPVRGDRDDFTIRELESKDLALLVVPGVTRSLMQAKLGKSASIGAEEQVRAIGYSVKANSDWLPLFGAVNEVGEWVLHDADIDDGYSGGPLYNAHGRVVAVNVQTIGPVARAIPIEEAVRSFRSALPTSCLTPPSPEKSVVAKAVLIDRGIGMRFRGIPAGHFTMGSPGDELGRYSNEGPQNEVRFAKGFWIGETEVTQWQWREVMGTNPSYFSSCGDDCPVENVTWYEAIAFTNKLSALAGLEECFELRGQEVTFKGPSCSGYRLPTEDEWEYAARAGTSTAYWSGGSESDLNRVGWYSANSSKNSDLQTHTVKGKMANDWGLHDVHGNVWEWTLSPWIENYAGRSDSIAVDPSRLGAAVAGPSGVRRVCRGGSFWDPARYTRSAFRYKWNPDHRIWLLGFRVLLPIAPRQDP